MSGCSDGAQTVPGCSPVWHPAMFEGAVLLRGLLLGALSHSTRAEPDGALKWEGQCGTMLAAAGGRAKEPECRQTLPVAPGTHGRGSHRPPPSSAVRDGWKGLFCESTRVGAREGSTPGAIRQVFGGAGHTTKTT